MEQQPNNATEETRRETGDGKATSDFCEEMEVKGSELVAKIKEAIESGNVRRIVVRKSSGEKLLETPLLVGAAAGGALTVFLPFIAAVAAIGALLAQVRVEIIRTAETESAESKADEDNVQDVPIEGDEPQSNV